MLIDYICKLIPNITAYLGGKLYSFIDFLNRIRLKPKYRCIISNNCNGGLICKALRIRYNSPTVGLSILIKDIITALNDYDYFFVDNKYNLKEIDSAEEYPVGIWADKIVVRFIHYDSFDEAYKTWCRRIDRLEKDSLYILLTCTEDYWDDSDLKRFQELEYKNKVLLTNKPYSISDTFYIRGNENQQGIMLACKRRVILRYIDQFDYVNFLNK